MIDNQRGECALPGDVILSLCFFCVLFSFLYLRRNVNRDFMKNLFSYAFALILLLSCGDTEKVYYAKDFGVVPNTGADMTKEVATAIGNPWQTRFYRESKDYC